MIANDEQTARRIVAADTTDAREALRRFFRASGLGESGFTRVMQTAVVDRFRKWLHDGNADEEIEDMVRDWLSLGRETPVVTDNLLLVFSVCAHAVKRRRMEMIESRAGYGKTTALRIYARWSGAIYYEYDEVSGPRTVLRHLCRAAGITGTSRTAGDMLMALREVLRARPRLIIVDQADTLPFKAVESIRSLYDGAHCPIVLAGIEGRMRRRLIVGSNRDNAEQISSRIAASITLPVPTVADVTAICARHGIRAARSIQYIHQHAAIGGYRKVSMLCEDAAEIAENNNSKSINFEHIERAAKYLIGCVSVDGEAA